MKKTENESGGAVREKSLPYGRQFIDEEDIEAVVDVLRSDWLTTGPMVEAFEESLAQTTDSKYAVAVSSGTAALHAAMFALGIGPGDEVIVPAMTFAATANCVVFQGGTPVFADVQWDTLLLDPADVEVKIGPRTKAIIAVDYAGQPCDYDALRSVAERHNLALVADACHALGGRYKGKPVGSLADLSTFSFHPVKPITTGEGGAITTDDPEMARGLRIFRNHGITTDFRERQQQGMWFYEMVELGFNYRITDIQCALGLSQLKRLPKFLVRRQEIARRYDEALENVDGVTPLRVRPGVSHSYHLYVVRLDRETPSSDRTTVFAALRADGIGVNVHYIPVHLHPYYRKKLGTKAGMCPVAEAAYEQILSLPMFPRLTEEDTTRVLETLHHIIEDGT